MDEEHQLKVSEIGMAKAQLDEAKANVGKYQAEVTRWASEVERLTRMVQEKVVDKQVLTETQRQLDSNNAVRGRASRRGVKDAEVKVADDDERKAAAMLAYTKVPAPYDAVVTVRNANTGDYVQAVTGDKSTANPSAIFVVARLTNCGFSSNVPEAYARYVQERDESHRPRGGAERVANPRRSHRGRPGRYARRRGRSARRSTCR